MKAGRLLVRLVIGGLFIGHGTQKLFGWFGGPGPEGTSGMMDKIGMHPPRRNALAAGLTETGGGALLAAGLATPLAAGSLIGVMITAIRKVHAANGMALAALGTGAAACALTVELARRSAEAASAGRTGTGEQADAPVAAGAKG